MIYELNQAALNCHFAFAVSFIQYKMKTKKKILAFQRKTFLDFFFWACYATFSYTSISNDV